MIRNAMHKNVTQSILRSLGRYLAIMAIIALGAGMFVGLLMTKVDMVATGQVYLDRQNMFDLRLITNYGWDQDSVEQIAQLDGVESAEGILYLDAVVALGERDDAVFRFYTIPEQVNQIVLRGGRMPQAPDECLIDGFLADDSYLGMEIRISPVNETDTLDAFCYDSYTIVGYVSTPLYMDTNRGTTTVGNGSITTYFFLPEEALETDYYTEIHLTIPGDYGIFTDDYNNMLEAVAEKLEPLVDPVAQGRLDTVKADAEEAYAEGCLEYQDGLRELEEGKLQAEQELEDAYSKLSEAQQEIADNEEKLIDGQNQINNAWATIRENEKTIAEAKEELLSMKEELLSPLEEARAELERNAAEVANGMRQIDDGIVQLEDALIQVNDGIAQLEDALSQIDEGIGQLEMLMPGLEAAEEFLEAALEAANSELMPDTEEIAQLRAELEAARNELASYRDQLEELRQLREPYAQQLQQLYETRIRLETELAGLKAEKLNLEAAQATIEAGFDALDEGEATINGLLADSEAQIADGEAQIASAKSTLRAKQREIDDGWAALEEGKAELEEGWQEYYDGKAEAEAEIADAEAKLSDAEEKLSDARREIDSLEAVDLMILDRNSNVGYNSLDSASDIVQSISKVFPVFFLLVASLVCITTMTRMIDEERTQIGTLKALGYSNSAIIGKYLIYSGSAAAIGCCLGLLLGSTAFPNVLWQAYKNMLFITDEMVLRANWLLFATVLISYTGVILLVSWFCCRRALEEVPAELIRPKAPEAGKKIFLEYLPFWKRISFLNKVTIRNIFRYRQRLAMMIVGIGGCTALLLTCFGLRDSIVNVVNYQFEEVTVYDMSVYFERGISLEEQETFLENLADRAENAMFYHQSSMELDYDGQTKEIFMIAAGTGVEEFIDFHTGNQPLELPGTDEVLLSAGLANMMGIRVGDSVTMRNSDMQVLELTVSGIYDNHIYNYAVLSPETIQAQWNETPEMQMAFVTIPDDGDAHEICAFISGMDTVMNVSVSEDLADMVGAMINALDLVVWVVVFCAGLLAVTVLYNLTNINITERIREIATIKVLGFRADETAMYVFKENLSLTLAGAVLGLGLGYLLLLFVMSNIKIDLVWFKTLVQPLSYLWSFLLTIVSALLVDLIFYFKLEKINMAEALKSVE